MKTSEEIFTEALDTRDHGEDVIDAVIRVVRAESGNPALVNQIVNQMEELEQLRTELTEAKKDQARYLWLHKQSSRTWLEEEIDAAIAAEEKGK